MRHETFMLAEILVSVRSRPRYVSRWRGLWKYTGVPSEAGEFSLCQDGLSWEYAVSRAALQGWISDWETRLVVWAGDVEVEAFTMRWGRCLVLVYE